MLLDIQLQIEEFTFSGTTVKAFVPDYKLLQNRYEENREKETSISFPFWGKIWPSSIALCSYLAENIEIVRHKTVVEIAAGLGLPSFFISPIAKSVICSDISHDAISVIQRSITLQPFQNITAQQMDWKDSHLFPSADIVLLSDVNYHKDDLETLFEWIRNLIQAGKTIILSTPERIVARDFLQKLHPYEKEHHVQFIEEEYIHLYVFE